MRNIGAQTQTEEERTGKGAGEISPETVPLEGVTCGIRDRFLWKGSVR